MKQIVTTNYTIFSPQIKNDIQIVLLSDIHYHSSKDQSKLNQIKNKIKFIHPTYILISGDILDNSTPSQENIIIHWLTELSQIAFTVLSLGNHDITIKPQKKEIYCKNNALINQIKSIPNLILLDNDIYEEKNFRFIGITLPFTHYYIDHEQKDKLIDTINQSIDTELSKDKYNIVLCHTPKSIPKNPNYTKIKVFKNANLILSGHMHGGMIPHPLRRIIKHHGLIGPFKSLFPKNAYGKYQNPSIIITSGITKLSARSKLQFLDFLWSAELVVITIKKEQLSPK